MKKEGGTQGRMSSFPVFSSLDKRLEYNQWSKKNDYMDVHDYPLEMHFN